MNLPVNLLLSFLVFAKNPEVEGYHKLTEADVDAIIADACLPGEQYRQIRDAVARMGQEETEKLKKNIS